MPRRSQSLCSRVARPPTACVALSPMGQSASTDFDDLLKRGRQAHRLRDWKNAYSSLSSANETGPVPAADLELLSTAAFMVGKVREMLSAQEAAYSGYIEEGQKLPAARLAFWVASNLASRGKLSEASGWVERGSRILEPMSEPCVERGYMLLPTALRHVLSGELEQVVAVASEAADIGRQFNDADLVSLASQTQARAMLHLGQSLEAFNLLDEVMLTVVAGGCSPVVTGLVYCSVLEGCYESHEVRRASVWTESLSEWCGSQPDLVAFTDQCLAHRSEILRLQGAWSDALAEAARSLENQARGFAAAQAHYQEAEIHRMRGDLEQAESAYQEVALKGGDPQPGLALLRLSMGNEDAAVASVRRALAEARGLLAKVSILPGYVEVMVATGYVDDAATASSELSSVAAQTQVDLHQAWAANCLGWVSLSRSSHGEAAASLREAMRLWEDLGMPYELACARRDLAVALNAMGDVEAGELQLRAARSELDALGAASDVRVMDETAASKGVRKPFGLTDREREVLSLLASGATNRAIAESLVLSERTIDRHVSNIFSKLGVNTRSAATAYAVRNDIA